MTRIEAPSYPVSIFVATMDYDDILPFETAKAICAGYCDDVGLCVTVTRTHFMYTDGNEPGVIVGLINYPRFPSAPEAIFAHAEALALRLIDGLCQQSAAIQAPDKTVWISFRPDEAA